VIPGIRGKPPIEPWRLVAPRNGHEGVGHLVGDQPQEQGRNQVEGVDEELDWIAENHDPVSIGKKNRARTNPDPLNE